MRLFLLLTALFLSFESFSQNFGKVLVSGFVVNAGSIPIPDVAIINIRTDKATRTNSFGFFQAEIEAEDSLLLYHIAYKKHYINKKDNGKLIILVPEIQELKQVDITDQKNQRQKNLEQTMDDILRLAPMKKKSGYDLHSSQEYFILENGSQTKGFSPFLGPTVHLPLEKITGLVVEKQKVLKKQTSHYHIQQMKGK